MKTSICITVFNEDKSVGMLLDSLINQTKKPDEIIIVDGGSTDNTLSVISNFQLPDFKPKIKFKVVSKKCTRAEGRNISVKMAKHRIVVIIDADCVATPDWLRKITAPFKNPKIDIVAGFYEMKADNAFQKAEAVFLGVMPEDFDNKTFLPSTRSIAFRKKSWKTVGGFPEKISNSAEDTEFNHMALKYKLNFFRTKNAKVEWRTPLTLLGFYEKMYSYARWDAENSPLWEDNKKLASHNIKSVFKIVRYALGLTLLAFGYFNPLFWEIFLIAIFVYFVWSFHKVYKYHHSICVGLWGIVVQIVSDFAGMLGFMKGVLV